MKKRKLIGKIFGIALVLVLIGVMLPLGDFAFQSQTLAQEPRTWHVDDDVAEYPAADFTKIQEAVDAASCGDFIMVYPGTYTENIDVNKDHLTIQSENGAGATIVQAANPDEHVFEVTADYVNINGFTVEGATESQKAGIYLNYADHCEISDNMVLNSSYGIYLINSSCNNISSNAVNSCTESGIVLDYSPTPGPYLPAVGHSIEDDDPGNPWENAPLAYDDNTDTFAKSKVSHNTPTAWLELLPPTETSQGVRFWIAPDSQRWFFGVGIFYDGSWHCLKDWNFPYSPPPKGEWVILDYPEGEKSVEKARVKFHSAGYGGFYQVYLSEFQFEAVPDVSCSNNEIVQNTVSNNGVGIRLYHSSGNRIYFNNFINNTDNGYSSDSTNFLNSPEEKTYTYKGNTYTNYLGNYWSDYEDRYPSAGEIDSTGIWDTPYSIDSDADNYPLVEPFENYEIGSSTYYANFLRMAQWLATQQRANGGVQEAEDYLKTITDNTAESIWTWSRYAELTGDYTTFLQNVNNAWDFCYANPSWEEGSSPTNYYTVYNVAWGLLAEMKYKEVYEGRPEYVDHTWYGEQCANTLINYTPGTGNTRSALCLGLAAGSLYQYGISVSNSAYCLRAAELGNSVCQWLEADVSRFASENWAVSGGVAVWGVLNSYFQENSDGDTWAEEFASYMPLDAHDGKNNSYEYGHDGWYAWGHYAVSKALDSEDYFDNYRNIIEHVLSVDGDEDGGIPRGPTYTDNQDFAWVTNVAAFALNLGLLGLEDITSPTVSSVSPQNSDTDVDIDAVVTATFSEAMDSSTITTESFTLAGSAVSGTVFYDPETYTATFTPGANLDYNHTYTATLSTAITDLAGNPLAEPYTWSFATESIQNHSPVASFTYSPEGPAANRQITFDAFSSYDSDGEIVSYEWNFGDGFTDSGVDTTHSYNRALTYLVILTVTDDKGATDTKEINIPVSLYGGAAIGPATEKCLEFANLGEKKRIDLYKTIKQVLNVEQVKMEREGKSEDLLFNYMNILIKQLDPERKDKDLREIDIVRQNALSEGQELVLSFLGGLAGAGIQFLTGVPAPFLGEGMKLLGFKLGESWVLGDISSATIKYTGIGRMEIVYRPSWDTMWVNVYLEEPVNQNVFMFIPVELKPLRTSWGTYICSPMWCGITCPPEAAVKEPVPHIEDVRIVIVDVRSPGELRVQDSEDRVTGLVGGEVKEEVPDSAYLDGTVIIFSPSDPYSYRVVGIDEDSYGLGVFSVEDGKPIDFTATDIPTTTGAVHQYTINWDALSEGEEGVTVHVDSDGDGITDYTLTADSELTGDEFIPQLSGCFIATAAYGTQMAQEIEILREFRDEYLLTNPVGQALVDLYYSVSPPIAEFITEHPSLKPIVRAGLVPAVAMSTVAVNTTVAEKMAIVGLLALVSVAVAIWVTRRRGRGPEYT